MPMPNFDLNEEIHRFRERLLDLTNRNPLLNYRKSSRRTIEIVEPSPDQIYKRLVSIGKSFRFEHQPEANSTEQAESDGEVTPGLFDESDEVTESQAASATGQNPLPIQDDHLLTKLSEARLETVAKSMAREAKTAIEETGINYLHLALGMLTWRDHRGQDKPCQAPLLLIPVQIERSYDTHGGKYIYTLAWTEDEVKHNLSLAKRIERDFGLILPEYDPESDLNGPTRYFEAVADVIGRRESWEVRPEALVGFFSFHKLMMYEDIAPENWKDTNVLASDSLAATIIGGRDFEPGGPLSALYAPDYEIDGNELAESILLADRADSSQHSALCDIAAGKSLVIEGPPGTGKSQTITNAIAMMIANGKRVLFVAEKMAALAVVKKKLEEMRLGDFCLELHSDGATSRHVFESLGKRLEATFRNPQKLEMNRREIAEKQSQIADYLSATETLCGPHDEPLYELLWRIVDFRSRGIQPQRGLSCEHRVDSASFSRNRQALEAFVTALQEFPSPQASPWWGFRPTKLNPNDIQPISEILTALSDTSEALDQLMTTAQRWGGGTGEWHQTLTRIDLSAIEKLASVKLSGTTELGRLLDPQARRAARSLVSGIQDQRDLQAELGECLHGGMEQALALKGPLRKLLKKKHANPFQNKSLTEIEAYRVWVASTQQALVPVRAAAQALEPLLKRAVRDIAEFEQGVAVQRLFEASIVEDAAAVVPGLFLNAATSELRRALEESQQLGKLRTELEAAFHLASVPPDHEIAEIAGQIRPHTRSWLRFFNREYRGGMARLKRFWRPTVGARPAEWVILLERLMGYRQQATKFAADAKLRRLFGESFQGVDTNWKELRERLKWVENAKQMGLAADRVAELLEARDAGQMTLSTEQMQRALADFKGQLEDPEQTKMMAISTNQVATFGFDRYENSLSETQNWIDSLLQTLAPVHRSRVATLADVENFQQQLVRYTEAQQVIADRRGMLAALGEWYQGGETKTADLSRAVQWCEQLEALRLPAGVAPGLLEGEPSTVLAELSRTIIDYRHHHQAWQTNRESLEEFGQSAAGWVDFTGSLGEDFAARKKIAALQAKIAELPAWAAFQRVFSRCEQLQVGGFAQGVVAGKISPDSVVDCYQVTVLNRVAEEMVNQTDVLQGFSRHTLETARARYQELDRKITQLNQERIAYEASRVEPPQGVTRGRVGELTEMGLIRHELQKQQRHCRIRDLLRRAGNSVQLLKPCFMMSPLSVAHYVSPGSVEFDLVVMDEASQIKPEDALGTILRAKQVVVVGDPKQLPPTSFFDRYEEEVDDDTATQFDNAESILEVAQKAFQPVRRLRWHYRSQHESLIQFSNQRFYDGDLVVFPSPTADAGRLGIRYHEITGATFQSGENLVEAEAVADAICRHVLERPGETLGVGAFNIRQSRLIEDLVDKRCDQDSRVQVAVEAFRQQHEDLFIKNLENLQGDERDVIFISYTYGPDPASGRVMNRFGPMTGSAGWRRLNVLITRARQRVEVFSSMRPSQIVGGPDKSLGVNAMRDYLEFAGTGVMPERGVLTGREPDSPFEMAVARVVESLGLRAVPQVGVAGYFIDIGVCRRDGVGDFILGIECDGATYHSSKSARDRDRLREEVIRSRGWNLHRIWSTDWFYNQRHEEDRLRSAILAACE